MVVAPGPLGTHTLLGLSHAGLQLSLEARLQVMSAFRRCSSDGQRHVFRALVEACELRNLRQVQGVLVVGGGAPARLVTGN